MVILIVTLFFDRFKIDIRWTCNITPNLILLDLQVRKLFTFLSQQARTTKIQGKNIEKIKKKHKSLQNTIGGRLPNDFS